MYKIKRKKLKKLTSVEICAGAGGQALGLEIAGFQHVALVENDPRCCDTLRLNRPTWNVVEQDLNKFNGSLYAGVDLIAGGVPCPPFSKAGKQLGHLDERDLFPAALKLVEETNPKAVLLENVRGLLDPKFKSYRNQILEYLEKLGYKSEWRLVHSANYRVPQLRPRAILVALKPEYFEYFEWPKPIIDRYITVGEALYDEISSLGWKNAEEWKQRANKVAPTLVGGSKKHGGADLGPTRAKAAWAKLGIDGKGIADTPPSADFKGMPRITVKMAAILQGFPKDWKISGRKTNAYKQIGNAFPPPVASAIGNSINQAIAGKYSSASVKDEYIEQTSIFASSEVLAV